VVANKNAQEADVSISNYQYTSDSSTVYQVSLPDDFALALGMSPAVGDEPYLDAAISPRYCSFFNVTLGSRSAIIGTIDIFNAIPVPLIVDGYSWYVRGYSGESIPSYNGPLLQCPQGPQGPPGADGAAGPPGPGIAYQTLEADGAIDAGTFGVFISGYPDPITATLPFFAHLGQQINVIKSNGIVDHQVTTNVESGGIWDNSDPPNNLVPGGSPLSLAVGVNRFTYWSDASYGSGWIFEQD
jgi:hypothetical protein